MTGSHERHRRRLDGLACRSEDLSVVFHGRSPLTNSFVVLDDALCRNPKPPRRTELPAQPKINL
jgi:hypothetical protein